MKILVVDDERDIQMLFEQRFRKEIRSGQIILAFAFSGEEALTYLNLHHHEAVLILSDINMPGMSGLELQRHLNESGLNIPIVFISGQATEQTRERALKSGAIGFFDKPFSIRSLLASIQSIEDLPRNGAH